MIFHFQEKVLKQKIFEQSSQFNTNRRGKNNFIQQKSSDRSMVFHRYYFGGKGNPDSVVQVSSWGWSISAEDSTVTIISIGIGILLAASVGYIYKKWQ